MIFRIPHGKHRARPVRIGLWWRRTVFEWKVTFTDDCRYDLGVPDQLDINKLVGIGYLPGHHKHSARFGWRYWIGSDNIELLAYCYVNGRRVTEHIGYCRIGETYRIGLIAAHGHYFFTLDDNDGNAIGEADVLHGNKGRLQYRLGTYFGGNQVSPRDMHIKLEKG
jgi:hypothetical protein